MRLNAESLRIIRLVHGCTQERLAALVGVHRSYIGKIEKGQRRLTPRIERRIVEALEIDDVRLAEILAAHERYNRERRAI